MITKDQYERKMRNGRLHKIHKSLIEAFRIVQLQINLNEFSFRRTEEEKQFVRTWSNFNNSSNLLGQFSETSTPRTSSSGRLSL